MIKSPTKQVKNIHAATLSTPIIAKGQINNIENTLIQYNNNNTATTDNDILYTNQSIHDSIDNNNIETNNNTDTTTDDVMLSNTVTRSRGR